MKDTDTRRLIAAAIRLRYRDLRSGGCSAVWARKTVQQQRRRLERAIVRAGW